MPTNQIRALSIDEVNAVAGGLQDGYQYCGIGGGVRPSYVDCPVGFEDYMAAFNKGVEQGKKKAQQKA